MSRRTPLQKITESDRGRNFNDGGGALSRENEYVYLLDRVNSMAIFRDEEWLTKPLGRVISKNLLLNRERIRARASFVDCVAVIFENQRDSRALPDVLPTFQNSGGHAAW